METPRLKRRIEAEENTTARHIARVPLILARPDIPRQLPQIQNDHVLAYGDLLLAGSDVRKGQPGRMEMINRNRRA